MRLLIVSDYVAYCLAVAFGLNCHHDFRLEAVNDNSPDKLCSRTGAPTPAATPGSLTSPRGILKQRIFCYFAN